MADGWGWGEHSPPPSPQLLNDQGSPVTREDVEETLGFVYDNYDAWMDEEWPGRRQELYSLGALNAEVVLDPLLQ
ncbi:hypothetical protein EJB05_02990, partial [Eragrostis curvula]